MTDRTAVTMDALEIVDFLESQRTGVLSLANGDDGYAIPVSFAFDDAGPTVYVRLGYAPGSRKRAFVDASRNVAFVVYADTDEGWKSVVAEGRLEELSRTSLDSTILEAVNELRIPFYSVHRRPARDLEFSVVRIAVETLNGIAEGPGGH